MNLEWNKVTWYSKAGAIILFLVVVPAITFKIGRAYESVIQIANQNIPKEMSYVARDKQQTSSNVAASSGSNLSGINGIVTFQGKPYSTSLVVKNGSGKLITETVSNSDGKFLVALSPGKYTIEPAKSSTLKTKTASVTVSGEIFTKIEMVF